MASPVLSQNENFVYNSMLARALMQLIPNKERGIMQLWLEKLHQMEDSAEEMHTRNEYMWFLLLQLQNKRITQPYTRVPPTHKLRPLKEILPAHIYEEVLTSTEQNMSWLEQVANQTTDAAQEEERREPMSSPPCQFLANQPTPRNGIICYFAAFSDQEY